MCIHLMSMTDLQRRSIGLWPTPHLEKHPAPHTTLQRRQRRDHLGSPLDNQQWNCSQTVCISDFTLLWDFLTMTALCRYLCKHCYNARFEREGSGRTGQWSVLATGTAKLESSPTATPVPSSTCCLCKLIMLSPVIDVVGPDPKRNNQSREVSQPRSDDYKIPEVNIWE